MRAHDVPKTDRDEVHALHRARRDAIGWRWRPEYETSLRELLAMGYCATDIAGMVGVSRERVRQWMQRCRIPAGPCGTRPREWDAARRCFVAVPVAVEQQRRAAAKAQVRRARAAARAMQTAHGQALELDRAITFARARYAETGEWPPLVDVLAASGIIYQFRLAQLCGREGPADPLTFAQWTDFFYEVLCGAERRPDGRKFSRARQVSPGIRRAMRAMAAAGRTPADIVRTFHVAYTTAATHTQEVRRGA